MSWKTYYNKTMQPPVSTIEDSHTNVSIASHKKGNILNFRDSEPNVINKKILYQKLFQAKDYYWFFASPTSIDFFHYKKPILSDPQTNFDIAVLHVGIYGILKLGSTVETVSIDILHIVNQCKNYGVNRFSISSVTCTTLLNSDVMYDVNSALRIQCQITG